MGHSASHSLTRSDTLDSDIVQRSLVMEMEVGDAGPSRLGYYNTKQQICKCNMCHARLTCTCIYDSRAQSAHWREAKMRMRIPSNNLIPILTFFQLTLFGSCIQLPSHLTQKSKDRLQCCWNSTEENVWRKEAGTCHRMVWLGHSNYATTFWSEGDDTKCGFSYLVKVSQVACTVV